MKCDAVSLKQILLEELGSYTGEGLNDVAYLTTNESEQIYTIVDVASGFARQASEIGTVLVARLANDQVVIELDRHDKLLVDCVEGAWRAGVDCISRIAGMLSPA